MNIIIIHYAEIALKGDNRRDFENKLVENIRHASKELLYEKIERLNGRVVIILGNSVSLETEFPTWINILNHVFGISHFSFGVEVKAEMEEIGKTLAELLKEKVKQNKESAKRDSCSTAKALGGTRSTPLRSPQNDKSILNRGIITFRITARRADKNFPLTSDEINYKVGEYIFEKSCLGLKVNLKNPDINCFIEIVDGSTPLVQSDSPQVATGGKALLYFDKIPALGGLPVGTSGKVLSLISSGFDSPVAAWHLMKRGARVDFVHFHSYPRTGKESINNVKNIVQILNRYQLLSNLYLVPLLDIQREIFAKCEGKYRILLYRRFMMKIAECVANDICAGALVTGESLGQVASQTLENIRVTDVAVSLPVFRPLIGMDKVEIINYAKKIGTYEISSQPYEDCCSLFTPLHPATKAKLQDVEFEESKLDSEKLIKEAIEKMEKIEVK